MKLRLVVEHDPDTKRWAAFFPELPGCASAGDTEEEAIHNAREALELWFEPTPVTLPAGAKVLPRGDHYGFVWTVPPQRVGSLLALIVGLVS